MGFSDHPVLWSVPVVPAAPVPRSPESHQPQQPCRASNPRLRQSSEWDRGIAWSVLKTCLCAELQRYWRKFHWFTQLKISVKYLPTSCELYDSQNNLPWASFSGQLWAGAALDLCDTHSKILEDSSGCLPPVTGVWAPALLPSTTQGALIAHTRPLQQLW